MALPIWVALLLLTNELWYRLHELNPAPAVHWWVNLPTNAPSFKQMPMTEFAQALLKHDTAAMGTWQETDSTRWTVYCLRWRAGDPSARMSARGHRPEYCLTGSGHKLVADLGTLFFRVHGFDLPFRAYVFDTVGQPMQVFFCLWEDGAERQMGFGQSKYLDRLRAVLAGRRRVGQQTMEIICTGYVGMEEAERAVRARLPELITSDS